MFFLEPPISLLYTESVPNPDFQTTTPDEMSYGDHEAIDGFTLYQLTRAE